jgi:hypothetical protein
VGFLSSFLFRNRSFFPFVPIFFKKASFLPIIIISQNVLFVNSFEENFLKKIFGDIFWAFSLFFSIKSAARKKFFSANDGGRVATSAKFFKNVKKNGTAHL